MSARQSWDFYNVTLLIWGLGLVGPWIHPLPSLWLTGGQEILTPEASFPRAQSQGNCRWLPPVELGSGDIGRRQEIGKKGAIKGTSLNIVCLLHLLRLGPFGAHLLPLRPATFLIAHGSCVTVPSLHPASLQLGRVVASSCRYIS